MSGHTERRVASPIAERVGRIVIVLAAAGCGGAPPLTRDTPGQARDVEPAPRRSAGPAPSSVAVPRSSVRGSGSLEAVSQVEVAVQLSGRVTSILVDVSSVVKKGDVLMEVDPMSTTPQARTSRMKVYAPVDGIVIDRRVDPGQTIVSGFNGVVVFVIAQDLGRMRVVFHVAAADAARLNEQMDAAVVFDAFLAETFRGVVSQIRRAPGVDTVEVVVEIDNPQSRLRPGMTANVTFR